MPLLRFMGGPNDGETRDIPQATGGATVTFRRESGITEYEFTGTYDKAGARVYRVKDAPALSHTEWPEPERPAKTPRPRRAGAKPTRAAAGNENLRAAFRS